MPLRLPLFDLMPREDVIGRPLDITPRHVMRHVALRKAMPRALF